MELGLGLGLGQCAPIPQARIDFEVLVIEVLRVVTAGAWFDIVVAGAIVEDGPEAALSELLSIEIDKFSLEPEAEVNPDPASLR